MRIFSILLICLISFGNINTQKSSIDFIIKNLGVNVDGHFNRFSITTGFNNKNELTTIKGIVEVSSIETGIESRDEHLLKEDYFHEGKFKQITLQSTSVKKNNNKEYDVTANLTIKGKTKQIIIPVALERLSNKIRISSSFKINRRDFNIGGGSFVMSKTVKIQVVYYQDTP